MREPARAEAQKPAGGRFPFGRITGARDCARHERNVAQGFERGRGGDCPHQEIAGDGRGRAMSYQAQTWVAAHCPYLFGAKRMVLMILANYADSETSTAWPGLERIALEGGLDRANVWRALHEMKDDRVII